MPQEFLTASLELDISYYPPWKLLKFVGIIENFKQWPFESFQHLWVRCMRGCGIDWVQNRLRLIPVSDILCSQSVLSWLNSCMHKTVLALVAVTWIRMLPRPVPPSIILCPPCWFCSQKSCKLHSAWSPFTFRSLILLSLDSSPTHSHSLYIYINLYPYNADNYFHLWS